MKVLPRKQSGDRQLIETLYTADLEKVSQYKDFRFSSGESDSRGLYQIPKCLLQINLRVPASPFILVNHL